MNSTLISVPETAEMAAREEIIRRFSDSGLMTRLIQKAVRNAVLDHKCGGNPVATSVNGEVVVVQPEDIVVPDEV